MQQLLRKRRIRFNQTVKRSSRGSDSITPERPQGHSRTAPSCFIRGPAAFSEYSYQIATVAVGGQIYELTGSATSAFESPAASALLLGVAAETMLQKATALSSGAFQAASGCNGSASAPLGRQPTSSICDSRYLACVFE